MLESTGLKYIINWTIFIPKIKYQCWHVYMCKTCWDNWIFSNTWFIDVSPRVWRYEYSISIIDYALASVFFLVRKRLF